MFQSRFFIFLILSSLSLAGCGDAGTFTPNPNVISPQDSKKLVDSIVFQRQSSTGLCFGLLNMTKFSTSGSASGSLSISQIDCDKIPSGLLRN